ncbi:MAG TPA: hypothetical protein VJ841_01675 [Candidatus Saccharimonadales bacterium]|nr:hypothetical protein [Candidatus Saccharimonadales bacterium]
MSIFEIISTIGIATILAAFIYIGRKLQILDDLQKTSHKIKLNVKVIGDHLTKFDTQFDPSELQSYSPLQLTSTGKKLIADIGFDVTFEENRSDFVEFIDSEMPKLKYDVELAAIKSIIALSDQEYMNPLKVFFYNNPKRSLQNVAPTLGIYVRDDYLKAHPEITE